MYISNQGGALVGKALLPFCVAFEIFLELSAISDAVDTYINHGCAGPDHVRGYHSRFAYGCYQYVCPAGVRAEIPRLAMTHGNCSVVIQQQHRDWLPNNIATAYDYSICSANGNIAAFQDFNHPGGSAGNQRWALCGKIPYVHRMKAIDILLRCNCEQYLFAVYLLR